VRVPSVDRDLVSSGADDVDRTPEICSDALRVDRPGQPGLEGDRVLRLSSRRFAALTAAARLPGAGAVEVGDGDRGRLGAARERDGSAHRQPLRRQPAVVVHPPCLKLWQLLRGGEETPWQPAPTRRMPLELLVCSYVIFGIQRQRPGKPPLARPGPAMMLRPGDRREALRTMHRKALTTLLAVCRPGCLRGCPVGRLCMGTGEHGDDPPRRASVHQRCAVHGELRLQRRSETCISAQAAHCSGTGGKHRDPTAAPAGHYRSAHRLT